MIENLAAALAGLQEAINPQNRNTGGNGRRNPPGDWLTAILESNDRNDRKEESQQLQTKT